MKDSWRCEYLGLDEEIRLQDARVIDRREVLRRLAVDEAGEVHDDGAAVVGVVRLQLLVGVAALHGVVLRDRPGALALDALVVRDRGERDVRVARGVAVLVLVVAVRAEEPQPVPQDRPADGGLVRGQDRVGARVARRQGLVVRRQARPGVVVEGDPEGPAERVAARLGDRVRDAAGEPPVLGGDRAGGRLRLFDGVLDVERARLVAQRLVQDHAVQQEEALVRHGSRERDVAVRARPGRAGRQQHRPRHRPADRQAVDEVLTVAGRGRRRRREVGGHRRRAHVHGLGQRANLHLGVERRRLGHLDPDRLFLRGEPGQFEDDLVVSGGEEGEDEVAVGRRHRRARALQRRRGDRHRHARKDKTLRVDNLAGHRAGGHGLRRRDGGHEKDQREAGENAPDMHVNYLPVRMKTRSAGRA